MIQQHSQQYSVRNLCVALNVWPSGYYRWLKSPVSAREQANDLLTQKIQEIFQSSLGNYGSPRVTAALRHQGQRCNHKRVEKLMRQQGLQGRRGRRRRARTTLSDHDQPVAPNLLRGRSAPTRPNEVWVADITYVPTAQGWLFVAAVMDLYSRQILGWSAWENLQAGGALQALKRALVKRAYPKGVIHHSDRGIQYACQAYRQELQRWDLVASMSRKGNCYDNAAMEAFWSTLKREALQESASWSKDQVRRQIFEYIEAIYNRSRLHSSLDYQSPVDFENLNN